MQQILCEVKCWFQPARVGNSAVNEYGTNGSREEIPELLFLCAWAPGGNMSAEADGCPAREWGKGFSTTRFSDEL